MQVLFSMGNIGLMFLFSMGNVGLMFIFYMKTDLGFFMQGSLKSVLYGEEESSACAHEHGEQRSGRSRCTWVHVRIDLMTNLEHFFMQGRLMFIFSGELMADLEYFFMQVMLETDMRFFMHGTLRFFML